MILNEFNWERYNHFIYYENKIQSGYTMTAKLDVSNLLRVKQPETGSLKISNLIYYCILKAINIPENFNFRIRKQDGKIEAFDELNAMFTIFHENTKTFSNVWSQWNNDLKLFCEKVEEAKVKYEDSTEVSPSKDKPKNCVPISIIPWIDFDSFCTDRYSEGENYFPVITLSKIVDNKITMSVYVKHSIADGYHTAMLFNDVQRIMNELRRQ